MLLTLYINTTLNKCKQNSTIHKSCVLFNNCIVFCNENYIITS